jgi:hypothetical protein
MISYRQILSCTTVILLSLIAKPSHAMLGEENAFLAQIVSQLGRQMVQLQQTAQDVRRNVAYARTTALWAQDAVQVARNVHYLAERPDLLTELAKRRFSDSFPEGEGLQAESVAFKKAVEGLAHAQDGPAYDAYAYAATLKGVRAVEQWRYELMVRKLDTLGVHKAHDAALVELRDQHEAASHNLAELQQQLRTVGLSPVRAPIYTARASSATAI